MRKIKRTAAMLLASAMTVTACAAVIPAAEDEGNVLKLTFSDTPETLNPHVTETDYELLADMIATLYRKIYNEESGSTTFVPDLAVGEPVPTDDTYVEWTVTINDGYTFADGTPIDAYTVEYSIKMLNDPKLANRNTNASDLLNGASYLNGECDWEDVGFKVIDDYTLQITYDEGMEPATITDFMDAWSFIGTGLVEPDIYEACLSADGTSCSYGAGLDSFGASALYEPTTLIQGQYLELTRRTDGAAPLEDVFTPDKVEYYAVTDTNTRIQMFMNGEIDAVVANQAAYDGYSGARYVYNPSNYGIFINPYSEEHPILSDSNFRYAMYFGLDRETLVKAVYPNALPSAYQYLPFATMPDPADPVNSTVVYRDTEEAQAIRIDGHEVTLAGFDADLALDYFQKAYDAAGGEKVSLVMKYSDSSDVTRTWAEALQDHYQKLFGEDRFEISLQATPYTVIYDDLSRTNMNYDLCCSCGWYENVTHPWNDTNWVYSGPYTYNTQYCVIYSEDFQKEWDELYYACAIGEYKRDDQKKLEYAARMEEILLVDACFIPAYAAGNRWFFSAKITPLMEIGDPDLSFCLMQAKFN